MHDIESPQSVQQPVPEKTFTVFYDGSCPICTKEIGFYKRRDGADDINWFDVSAVEGGDVYPSLGCEVAMKRFHVARRDGSLASGGVAFAALWRELPAFRIFGLMFKPKPMAWALDRAYDVLLKVRPAMQKWAR